MRKGFKANKEELPKVGWNGTSLKAGLTMKFMSHAMQNQYFVREGADRYSYVFSDIRAELCVHTLLKLMGMSVEDLLE
jgi:imidazoleglycerol phosphate synthase glutamine amidotransferase subunit HisH